MKTILWIIAVLTGLLGGAFLVFCIYGIVAAVKDETDERSHLPGYLLCAAAGWWCAAAAVRFMRQRNEANAIKLGRPAAVMVFMVMLGVGLGPLEEPLIQVHPLLYIVMPFVAGALAWSYFRHAHKPMARRAYVGGDDTDPPAQAGSGSTAESPRDAEKTWSQADLGQLRAILEPTEELLRQLRHRILAFSVPLCALAAGAGLYLGVRSASNGLAVAIAGVLVVIVMGGSLIVSYQTQRRSLMSLRIGVSDHGIARTQTGFPNMTIRFDEIEAVKELGPKGLLIVGRHGTQQVFVPRHVSDFETLRSQLEKVRPITIGKASRLAPLLGGITGVITVAGMVVAFIASNRALVTTTASILIVVLSASIVIVWRNPHLDRRAKRSMLAVLFPIAGLALRLWAIWTAPQ